MLQQLRKWKYDFKGFCGPRKCVTCPVFTQVLEAEWHASQYEHCKARHEQNMNRYAQKQLTSVEYVIYCLS